MSSIPMRSVGRIIPLVAAWRRLTRVTCISNGNSQIKHVSRLVGPPGFAPGFIGIYFQEDTRNLLQINDVEIIPLHKGKDLMRLNLTLVGLNSHFDGATVQCVMTDVSAQQKSENFALKVYGKY